MQTQYLMFNAIRYRTRHESKEQVIENIENALGIKFVEPCTGYRNIVEEAIVAYPLGLEFRLNIWHDGNELVFVLDGRTLIYRDWEKDDIIKITDYIQELLASKNLGNWYIPSSEESYRDAEKTGDV